MVFSGVCCNIKWGKTQQQKQRKTFTIHIEIQADSGHVLSLSAVLLLYPLGLIADSC